ncbi:MAG: putative toxin-antitoxin system toxin component, PIN family [Syntrophobacteraceae bacterium]
MIKVVLDTNVFVSAVIKADSKPGRILELVRSGGLELCVSPDILEEIRATLAYPKLEKFHRRDSKWIASFIRELSAMAKTTPGKTISEAIESDPSGNIYLVCALEGKADFIVSGDHHLTDLKEYRGIRILNPAAFLEIIGQRIE